MALNVLQAGKTGSKCTPVTLVKGDGGTYAVCMSVDRYYGGVDLSPLSWSVTVENAAGATDEYKLTAKVNEKTIEMEWIPEGTATAAAGITEFKLSGFGGDSKSLVWQSGTYYIRIDDTITYVPGSETEVALTNVQKLIVYVDGELNRVIKAADAAEAATETANKAADRADNAASAADNAAFSATSAASEANRAAADASVYAGAIANEFKGLVDMLSYPFEASGDMVKCNPLELYPLEVQSVFEHAQYGSGDPTPDNVRPIIGLTSAKLTRCGKNILGPVRNWSGTRTHNGVKYTENADGSISVKGTADGLSYAQLNVKGFRFIEGTPYMFTGAGEGTRIAIGYFSDDGSGNFETSRAFADYGESQVVSDISGMSRIYLNVEDGVTVDTVVYPQCEINTVATPYESYMGDVFTTDFGRAVYSGALDWNTGVLTVDKKMITLTGETGAKLTSTSSNAPNFYYASGIAADCQKDGNYAAPPYGISSHYSAGSWTEAKGDPAIFGVSPTGGLGIRYEGTIDEANAWLAAQNAAGTPVQFLLMLIEPVTMQLEARTIRALKGLNVLFGDGEIFVAGSAKTEQAVRFDTEGAVRAYTDYFIGASAEVTSFMYFTDPHWCGAYDWQDTVKRNLDQMVEVYKRSPVDFCVCGGDLMTGDTAYSARITRSQAVNYMSTFDRMCRERFGGASYFGMLGNHDYNYQSAELDQSTLDALLFRRDGRAYYSHKTASSVLYVLNSGRNWYDNNGANDYNVPMSEYKWVQVGWLASALKEDDPEHAIITQHIIVNNKTEALTEFFGHVSDVCAAYNARSSIEKNGVVYDFSACSGKVELFLGGHMHSDNYRGEAKGIPYVLRANAGADGTDRPTFDLVFCDWGQRMVKFKRIGYGEDIEVNLK